MPRITAEWREWVSDLSEVRLRQTVQQIESHQTRTGELTEPDLFLLKLCKTEIEKRYA